MFAGHKYVITFRKRLMRADDGSPAELEDVVVLTTLYRLMERYKFEVVRVNLAEWSCISEIIIRTSKKQKDVIFLEFSGALKGYVYDMTWRMW